MPSRQRIAILFAVPQEQGPTVRLLRTSSEPRPEFGKMLARHGSLGTKDLLLLVGGMGQKRAGIAAEMSLREWQPDLLVMAGVAGALSAELNVADVIAANAICTGADWLTASLVPQFTAGSHHTGCLLSIADVLVTADDKRQAVANLPQHPTANGQHPIPLAVEMETAAVAQAAMRYGVPWAAVRAVSDTATESLPLDFNRLRTPNGDLPTSRVALAAITHPSAIPGLIRLGKNTNLAAEALARFLKGWLSEL